MTQSKDVESKCQTHIESTYIPNTITPVHRSRFRPASDTRGDQPRTDNALRRHAWPQGSNGRTRHCRRSGGFRTRHGPYERMSDPEDNAHTRMWRPCLPDGEVYPLRRRAPPAPPQRPLRNPAQNLAKAEAGLPVRTYTTIFCCSHPDEAREAMGRYQGTPGGSGMPYMHPSHALRPKIGRNPSLVKY